MHVVVSICLIGIGAHLLPTCKQWKAIVCSTIGCCETQKNMMSENPSSLTHISNHFVSSAVQLPIQDNDQRVAGLKHPWQMQDFSWYINSPVVYSSAAVSHSAVCSVALPPHLLFVYICLCVSEENKRPVYHVPGNQHWGVLSLCVCWGKTPLASSSLTPHELWTSKPRQLNESRSLPRIQLEDLN